MNGINAMDADLERRRGPRWVLPQKAQVTP